MRLRMQAGEERELTPEECDVLDLPRGTKLVGEMSEMMQRKLTKGKYEDTAALRYFGNEKIRASNYFGKKKLEVNVVRMSKKIRRAEIEELMDTGMSYDAAAVQVDAALAARAAALEDADIAPEAVVQSAEQVASYVEQLFRWVDTDNSGSVTPGEMATAFQRLRGEGSDYNQVLRDVNALLAAMDRNQDGQVSLEEFEKAADLFLNTALPASEPSAPRSKTEEEKVYIAQLFAWVDTDGSGSVTPGEMATAFQRLRGEESDYSQVLRDVNVVLSEMDVNKDGTISLAEFQHAADLFMALAEAPAEQQPEAAGDNGGAMGFLGSLFR